MLIFLVWYFGICLIIFLYFSRVSDSSPFCLMAGSTNDGSPFGGEHQTHQRGEGGVQRKGWPAGSELSLTGCCDVFLPSSQPSLTSKKSPLFSHAATPELPGRAVTCPLS